MMEWKSYYREELADPAWKKRFTGWLEQTPDPRLVQSLSSGGIPSVPHTAAAYSGRMIAGLVSALYDCGVKRVLALGVLHTSMLAQAAIARDPEQPLEARREAAELLSGVIMPREETIETTYGVLPAWRPAEDPGVAWLDREEILAREFSLDTMASVLSLGARVHGRTPLALFRAYVGLTRDPIDGGFRMADGVANWVRHHWTPETAVVTTGDLVHFGTAYGMAGDDPRRECHVEVLTPRFQDEVSAALELGMRGHDQSAYVRSSDDLHSDQREILPVLSRLLGQGSGHEILDFSLSDYVGILSSPPPCLVASALVLYQPGRPPIE